MKKLPKESKLTPQVENKTRHTDDYENEIEAGKHNVKSPLILWFMIMKIMTAKSWNSMNSIIGITETKTESGRNLRCRGFYF